MFSKELEILLREGRMEISAAEDKEKKVKEIQKRTQLTSIRMLS